MPGKEKIKTTRFTFFKVYIIGIIVLKFILMGLFSSEFQNNLFIPFTDLFAKSIFSLKPVNPYNYFFMTGRLDLFPYPPFMLYIETFARFLSCLAGKNFFFQNAFFKIPILILDIVGLLCLVRIFPDKKKYIAVLYFSSPIIIYATYMHSQLDLIPTVLLLVSIYYLTRQRPQNLVLSAVFLGLSLSTKFHILATLPIILLFIYKRDGFIESLCFFFTSVGVLALMVLPFWSKGFINCVLMNSEQNVLTSVYLNYGVVLLYIPILAVFLLYLKVYTILRINRDMLYSLLGVLFTIFLALESPMPGWYVWVVPYIAIFFIQVNDNKYRNMLIYFALNIMYLFYFIFIHKTKYVGLYFLNINLNFLKINNPLVSNVAFTTLTGLLIFCAYLLYNQGVTSNSYYRRNQTFTIGISGDSGSGKSRLIKIIEEMLGAKNLLFIEGDGDHRWGRDDERRGNFTNLNPKANYIYRQANDLYRLHHGEHIMRVDYDHNTGGFTEPAKVVPKPYTILCGLHALYLPQARENLDLKIYMDTDEMLRRFWKIQRDTGKRGYTLEQSLKQIENRMPDAVEFIYPQKQFADLIISYYDPNLKKLTDTNYTIKLNLRMTMSSSVNLESLISYLQQYFIQATYNFSKDLKKQTVIFSGDGLNKKNIDFDKLDSTLLPRLEEITRQHIEEEDNLHGIVQTVILLLINQKMQGDIL